jgi:murein DD-endopeptidase MepM/ murein hydrolase activator NlpD
MKLVSVLAPVRSVVVTASVGAAFGSIGLLSMHYLGAARNLAVENAQLKDQMQDLVERLAEVEGQMAHVQAARKEMDRTTLAGLGSILNHAGISPEHEARLARAMAPIEDTIHPLAGPRAGYGFVNLLDRLGTARDNAGRLVADLGETADAIADRAAILRAMPSVLPAKGSISSEFGMRESPFHPGFVGMHNGIDVAAEEGTPVTATADGVVVFAGNNGSFGKLVTIDHGFGITTKYGHNSIIMVKKGEHVVRGQSIATVGNTGRSTGAHSHYEVAIYDKPVDPRRFLFDAKPEDTAPTNAAPTLAHLALGGDAPAPGDDAVQAHSGVEWDAPVFAVRGGILLANVPAALRDTTTGDLATAAICFLVFAIAGAVVRVPSFRKKRHRGHGDDEPRSGNDDLIREYQKKERLKQQAAEF